MPNKPTVEPEFLTPTHPVELAEPAQVPDLPELDNRHALLWPMLLLVLSLAVTAFVWRNARQQVDQNLQRDFEQRVATLTTAVNYSLAAQAQQLRSLAGFFQASSEVTPEDFHNYFNTIQPDGQDIDFAAMAHLQYLPSAELKEYIRRKHQQDNRAYQLFPPGPRDFYTPIRLIEPLDERNQKIIGFDASSKSGVRATLLRTRDSGQVGMTPKTLMRQDAGEVSGFVMYQPIYRNTSAIQGDIAQRQAALTGWVGMAFRMQPLMERLLSSDMKVLHVQVYDGDAITPQSLFFDSAPPAAGPSPVVAPAPKRFQSVQRIAFGGQTWTLAVQAAPGFVPADANDVPRLLAMAGALLSLLLSFGLWQAIRSQRLRVHMVTRQAALAQAHAVEAQRTQTMRELRDNEYAARLAMDNANRALAELEVQKYALDQHAIVATTDLQGKITYANARFCEISGYSNHELLGRDHAMLNSGTHPHGFFQAMYDQISLGQVWHGEVCNRAKDGHLYWVNTTVVPFMNSHGKPEKYIAIRADITERKQAELELLGHRNHLEDLVQARTAQLRQAEEAAQAANRAKSEFLANMSHEIRTPMNGVIGMVDILQETELKPAQQRMLGTIHVSSLALLQVLNDILDFSKMEAGKMTVESVPMHLREVAEGVAQLMVSLPASKATELSLFVSPELPDWLLGDPSRLRQVLLNLLGNAIKFSANKGKTEALVSLHIEPCRLAGGADGVRLSVIDNGIGMSPEVVAKLFQPFTQADESTARKFGGTGLGLSISQRLVELMGGRITVRSTLGEGSEFTVELPLQLAPPERQLQPMPGLAGVLVLLVAQKPSAIKIRSAYCQAAGAQTHVVPDIAAAQHWLAHTAPTMPCVVLIDRNVNASVSQLGLPAEVSVVRMVRQGNHDYPGEHTVAARPLIFRDFIAALAQAGGQLTPSDPDHAHERRQHPRPPAPTLAQAVLSQRLILLAEDNETNRDVLQEQLRLLGYTCEVAVDGAVALRMWQNSPGRYALLLTDCHMPNLDGFGLTEVIRAQEPAGTRLPIIAVTANAMQGEAERCRQRGMDDYLSKPLRMKELATMLGKWLPLDAMAPQAPDGHAADTPRHEDAPFPIWNPNTLSELVGDNPALHKRFLEKFLANAEKQVANILVAVAAEDADTVGGVAHALKSAARSVGALALGELCESLETAGHDHDAAKCSTLAVGLTSTYQAAAGNIRHHLDL
jgi:PAS domain S-box-containing protein